ncbi:MAG: PAS domain S-box protein [Acidisphaera sp.]|nr:PAS domain S-box protein [Acidisphaera sp.]
MQPVSPAERQDRYRASLLELGDRLLNTRDPAEMGYVAAEIVGRTLEGCRAGYGTIDNVLGLVEVARDWTADGFRPLFGRRRFLDDSAYRNRLARGVPILYADTARDAPADSAAAWLAVGAAAVVNVPVFEAGTLVAVLYLHKPRPHAWTADEVLFLADVAERTRSAVERRRAENALRRLNESLERQIAERTADRNRLWQLSADVMLVARMDGAMVAVNPAWRTCLDWSESELIGHAILDFIHPEDVAFVEGGLRRLAEGRAITESEARWRHRDGSYRWLSWNAVPGDGLINAVGRDVTAERERAAALARSEAQLRQAQKMEAIGQLTGGLAHDFNNVLTGIVGNLELLEVRLAQGRFDDLARYVADAQSAADRAAAVTQRLLAFARQQTLEPKPVDANQLITDLSLLIGGTMGAIIRVETALSPELWTTLCDPNQLESALLNLCINARDAMASGGSLLIETANLTVAPDDERFADLAPGEYVAITVHDTGTGMSADVVARAFDPFFTTKPVGQGTGLGLSMIYGFAQQSGGRVDIKSEQQNGTAVRLLLPRHVPETEEGVRAPVPQPPFRPDPPDR